jgi:hypothetical protein
MEEGFSLTFFGMEGKSKKVSKLFKDTKLSLRKKRKYLDIVVRK